MRGSGSSRRYNFSAPATQWMSSWSLMSTRPKSKAAWNSKKEHVEIRVSLD